MRGIFFKNYVYNKLNITLKYTLNYIYKISVKQSRLNLILKYLILLFCLQQNSINT